MKLLLLTRYGRVLSSSKMLMHNVLFISFLVGAVIIAPIAQGFNFPRTTTDTKFQTTSFVLRPSYQLKDIYNQLAISPYRPYHSNRRGSRLQPLYLDSTTTALIEGTAVLGVCSLLLQIFVYWRMQFLTAAIIGGSIRIPKGSNIAEMDAADGKNIFYLPPKCSYTAVMPLSTDMDAKKKQEKMGLNEQLILESIGKANAGNNNLNLVGKMRSQLEDIPSNSMDCVVSIGALGRIFKQQGGDSFKANQAKVEAMLQAYRMLRPGGLFVFVEPDGEQNTLDLMYKVFPEEIRPGQKPEKQKTVLVKEREKQWASRDSMLGTSNDGTGASASSLKKNSKSRSKKLTAAEELKLMNQANKQTKKGGGASKSRSLNPNVNTFTGNDEVDEKGAAGTDEEDIITGATTTVPDTSRSIPELANEEEKEEEEKEVDAVTENSLEQINNNNNQQTQTRPGVSYEVVSNVIYPYITGIAVKPSFDR